MFTGWCSTTTTPRPSALRLRATWPSRTSTTVGSFGFAGPFPDIRQLRQRRRGQNSAPAQVRYDVLDRPLGSSPLEWGLGSSLSYLNRSEPDFHARNVGRLDFYPHRRAATSGRRMEHCSRGRLARHRTTTISQIPDLTGANGEHPVHQPRSAQSALTVEARWTSGRRRWSGTSRSRSESRTAPRDRAGNHLPLRGRHRPAGAQRLAVRPDRHRDRHQRRRLLAYAALLSAPARTDSPATRHASAQRLPSADCASGQAGRSRRSISSTPNFGGALIPGRRNVFESTLDLTGVGFPDLAAQYLAHHLAAAL